MKSAQFNPVAGSDFRTYGTLPEEADYLSLMRCGINRAMADSSVSRVGDSDGDGRDAVSHQDIHPDWRYDGLLFTFRWPGTNEPYFRVLRLDSPPKEVRADGTVKDKVKYLAQRGTNRLMFPPGIRPEWLGDVSLPLLIVEGVKKTLAAAALMFHGLGDATERPRFAVCGIQGVYGYSGKHTIDSPNGGHETAKGLLSDFRNVSLESRSVILVYDADVHTNDSVRIARLTFAKKLREECKARVLFVDIPLELGLKGFDNVCGQLGPATAIGMIESAYDPKGHRWEVDDWHAKLMLGKPDKNGNSKPLSCTANVLTALRSAKEWEGVLAFDDFGNEIVTCMATPWGTPAGHVWTDADDTLAQEWMQRQGIMASSSKTVGEAVQAVARENAFNPVRDRVDALEWDRQGRLATWLVEYLGCEDTDYVRAVGRRWLISLIARLYRPGCKADHVLMLEGPQGKQKSTALSILVGDGHLIDQVSELGTKDCMLEMAGMWLIELAEIENYLHDVRSRNRFKAFLTKRDDYFREPFGRRPRKHPRHCILAASTNLTETLTDPTGTRRIWPVRCGKIDIAALRRDTEQLLAEARDAFLDGESWWLETEELESLARNEQEERYEAGVWDSAIEEWVESPKRRTETDWVEDSGVRREVDRAVEPWDGSEPGKVTLSDILVHCIGKSFDRIAPSDRLTVVRCLQHLKYARRQIRSGKLRGKWFYVKTDMQN